MADMGAACVASAGAGLRHGSAASMTMYPVVPDLQKYPAPAQPARTPPARSAWPGTGSSSLLHYLFIYKAKARPGWHLIPE